ncbi:MAG: ROK family protein [Verrucomicrobiae bacterium]|nr:ROK family protein [Verrucomicrobiae bacterium]
MSKGPYTVGIDLGGTKMFTVVFDGANAEIGAARMPTQGFAGPESGLKRIEESIREALKDAGIKTFDVSAVGIGCPGVVDFETGILRHAPNLGWKEVSVGKFLAGIFKCPTAVLNDVDAGTFGEYRSGAGKGARSLLGVFPGTGVGGGFVYEGKILRGRRASCMEIGNIRLIGSTLEGAVDEPVTLEALASRLSIAATCAMEAYRGNAPYIMEKAGTDLQRIKSGIVKKAIDSGDASVESIVKRSIEYLGLGIAAAVDLLGPDRIVIGGGLVEKMPDLYRKGLRKSIQRNASPALVEEIEISIAELGDYAVARGAAVYATEQGQTF